ncbi:hypothetical protein FOL47_009586 [Perkinsus chesapeaki]|uniref:Chromo domain-containing protein n=1 Tax=Perkinsus chesapeaki TaxID=330153 RepID=A0A7J6MSL3_PERCH|nr:hypothetical protein FOL47_009586 [Perkinsus chesapeaki]
MVHPTPRFFSTADLEDTTERRRKRMMGIRSKEEMAESARRYTENTGVDPHLSDDEDELDGKTFTANQPDELAELCLRKYRTFEPERITDRKLKVLMSTGKRAICLGDGVTLKPQSVGYIASPSQNLVPGGSYGSYPMHCITGMNNESSPANGMAPPLDSCGAARFTASPPAPGSLPTGSSTSTAGQQQFKLSTAAMAAICSKIRMANNPASNASRTAASMINRSSVAPSTSSAPTKPISQPTVNAALIERLRADMRAKGYTTSGSPTSTGSDSSAQTPPPQWPSSSTRNSHNPGWLPTCRIPGVICAHGGCNKEDIAWNDTVPTEIFTFGNSRPAHVAYSVRSRSTLVTFGLCPEHYKEIKLALSIFQQSNLPVEYLVSTVRAIDRSKARSSTADERISNHEPRSSPTQQISPTAAVSKTNTVNGSVSRPEAMSGSRPISTAAVSDLVSEKAEGVEVIAADDDEDSDVFEAMVITDEGPTVTPSTVPAEPILADDCRDEASISTAPELSVPDQTEQIEEDVGVPVTANEGSASPASDISKKPHDLAECESAKAEDTVKASTDEPTGQLREKAAGKRKLSDDIPPSEEAVGKKRSRRGSISKGKSEDTKVTVAKLEGDSCVKKESPKRQKKRKASTKEVDDAIQHAEPTPSVSDDSVDEDSGSEEEVFNVEKLLQWKLDKHGHRKFLVKWEGYPLAEATWEPESNFNESPEIEELKNVVLAKPPRLPRRSHALAVECGGDTSGRARATLQCVSQWIHSFCRNSSGIAVKEYGPFELLTIYGGAPLDMLEAILTEATSKVHQKQVIIIRDPTACFGTSSSAYSGGFDDDDEGDDDAWDDSSVVAPSSSDCATGLAVWLSERVPLGVRIVFLLPTGSMIDTLGRVCGLVRLSMAEVPDLASCTIETTDSSPRSTLFLGGIRETGNDTARGGLVCLYGRSGSGKTQVLRHLKESAISGRVVNVRIADILAAELGESQRRLRKVYSELASSSKFLPAAFVACTFDDCDLWLKSSGKIIREVLSQWTGLIDKHGNDILTVITCQDKSDLPRALSCRVCKWIDLNGDNDLT